MKTGRGQAFQIAPTHRQHASKGTATKVNHGPDAKKRRAIEDHQQRMREKDEWSLETAA